MPEIKPSKSKVLTLDVVKSLKFEETIGADHIWSGIIIDGTAGEDLVFPNVCYLKNDGKYWKSDADAVTTMPVVAMATATIAADASGIFLLNGYMRDDTWAWTVGGILFADEATGGTAGAMNQTAPAGSGDQVQVVGYALTADIVYFIPCLEMVEIT